MVKRILADFTGELFGGTLSLSLLANKASTLGSVQLEDVFLYLIFPVTAGICVHLFRRISDRHWFNDKDEE